MSGGTDRAAGVDLLIVGAGPAGMSAAVAARAAGLSVMVLDEQPHPGGQVWRNAGQARRDALRRILGAEFARGVGVVAAFLSSGVDYRPGARMWNIEESRRVFFSCEGRAQSVRARAVLLATGAQERPAPFPGWTLPGVMGVGGAQVTLKNTGQVPDGAVWIAGCGPLAYLYATQLLRAGGRIAGFLDTTPAGRLSGSVGALARAALAAPGALAKGMVWRAGLQMRVPWYSGVSELEAQGAEFLEGLSFLDRSGRRHEVAADLLLVHEGVIPGIHPTLALGCAHDWNADQDSFAPRLNECGETSVAGVYVAGDAAGIGGAEAACLRGELAALGIAGQLFPDRDMTQEVRRCRARLGQALALRPFLDRHYRPRREIFEPDDRTLVCRCEGITAAQVRALATDAPADPNRVKAVSRVGMGACQGRQCSYAVSRLIGAQAGGVAPAEIGVYRARPPLKPLTLSELAALGPEEEGETL